jgi:hypothetical protein
MQVYQETYFKSQRKPIELRMNSPSLRKEKTNAKGTVREKRRYLYISCTFVKRRRPAISSSPPPPSHRLCIRPARGQPTLGLLTSEMCSVYCTNAPGTMPAYYASQQHQFPKSFFFTSLTDLSPKNM